MSENSGGVPNPVPPEQSCYCKECQQPLSPPDAPFCSHCGASQQDIQKKQCLLCPALLLPNAQYCESCSAPQNSQLLKLMPFKKCECGAQLIATSSMCYNCKQPQTIHVSTLSPPPPPQKQQPVVCRWDNQPPEVSVSIGYLSPLVSQPQGTPQCSHPQGTSNITGSTPLPDVLPNQPHQSPEVLPPTTLSYSQIISPEQASVPTNPLDAASPETFERDMDTSSMINDQPIDNSAMDVDLNVNTTETQTLPANLPTLPSVNSIETSLNPPASFPPLPPSFSLSPMTPPSLPPFSNPAINGKRQSLVDKKTIEIPEKKSKSEDTGSMDGSSTIPYSSEKGDVMVQETLASSGNAEPQLIPSKPTYGIQGDDISVCSQSPSNTLPTVTTKDGPISNTQMIFGSTRSVQLFSVSPQPPTNLQAIQVSFNKTISQSGSCKVENDPAKTKTESLRSTIQSKVNTDDKHPNEESKLDISSIQLSMTKADITKQNKERKRRKTETNTLQTDQDETQPPISKKPCDSSNSFQDTKATKTERTTKGNNNYEEVSSECNDKPDDLDTHPLSTIETKTKLQTTSSNPLYIGEESDSEPSSSLPSTLLGDHKTGNQPQAIGCTSQDLVPYQKLPYENQADFFSGKEKDKVTKEKKKKDDKQTKDQPVKNKPRISESLPHGLRGDPRHMVRVVFHALLPSKLWEFDETSEVYIRFGCDKLGAWTFDHGPMKALKCKRDDSVLMLNFALQINTASVHGVVPYKYCVYTPKTRITESEDAQYEYLYSTYQDVPAEFANRVLKIDYHSPLQNEYHQFDTMIYPSLFVTKAHEDKGYFKKFKEFGSGVISFFTGGGTKPENTENNSETASESTVELPKMEDMRKYCLDIYLEDYLLIFKTGINDMMVKPMKLIKDIANIYKCLHAPIIHDGTPKSSGRTKEWKCPNLIHDLKKLLLSITSHFDRDADKRILGPSMTVCCLEHLNITIAKDPAVRLLQLFTLQPDIVKRQCLELNVLREFLSKNREIKLLLLKGFVTYSNHIMETANGHNHLSTLFNLLAVYHLIKGDCEPFEKPESNPQSIKWTKFNYGPTDISLSKLRDIAVNAKPGTFKSLYLELQCLSVLDPLLLPNLTFSCPIKEYESLFEVLPPFYGLARMGNCISLQTRLRSEDVQQNQVFLFKIHAQIDKALVDYSISQSLDVKCNLDAICFLLETLKEKLNSLADPFITFFKSNISLTLKMLSLFMTLSDDNTQESRAKKIDSVFYILNQWIKAWINNVVGGVMFGKKTINPWSMLSLSHVVLLEKQREEFEAWEHILLIECPTSLSRDWQTRVISSLKSRISKVPPDLKIDILTHAEKHNANLLIVNAILEDVTHGLDELILKGGRTGEESFKKLEQSEHMAQLLGNMLKKKYPNFETENSLSLDDILTWELWPGFMKIYIRQRSFSKEGLTMGDQEICHAALTIFTSVCLTVLDGFVTAEVLHKLNSKQDAVRKLCEAITSQGKQPAGNPETSIPTPSFSYENISESLDIRLCEYKAFIEHQEKLSTLVQHLTDLNIPELNNIRTDLEMNFEAQPISSLCQQVKGTMIFYCFQSASPLFPITSNFTALVRKYPNNTFNDHWDAEKKGVQNMPLQLVDVVEHVWEPAFMKCCAFFESLQDKSIRLAEVDKLLDSYTKEKLILEIKQLEKGICHCTKATIPDDKWIESCVHKMQLYHSLRRHASAAKAFLDLKVTLELSGDFDIVERLAAKFTTSVHDKSLDFITDDLINTGEFLHDISSDPRKLKCIEVFAKSQDIVKWIRNETKDMHDLQNFVTIALATAAGGEGDFTHDRLSNLRTVGSGFASLIYQLPPDTGYKELVKRCKSLWDALKDYPMLPEMLKGCADCVAWYQSVKETQGSVEKSSFGQMKNIKEYGCYTIGSQAMGVHSKLSQLIRMHLEQCDKPLPQRKYSLNELRDLESKLVLITGSESEEREQVDHFLKVFQTVCYIADVLSKLQQTGHSNYMGWVLKFPCKLDGVVDHLTKIFQEMEKDLEDWKKTVAEKREEYYSLNYYTTQQLLHLRKELGSFKNHDHKLPMKQEVIALLQCLSQEITQEMVEVQLCGVDEEMEVTTGYPTEDTLSKGTGLDNDLNISHSSGGSDNQSSATGMLDVVMKAASSGPHPQLNENDLTDKQMAILVNLKTSYGFSRNLILLAFERCAKSDLEETVLEWCSEHQDDFDFFDNDRGSETRGDESSDEDEYLPSDDKEEDAKMDEINTQQSFESFVESVQEAVVHKKSIPKVIIREHIPVDENHPIVKELLRAGFPLEQCKDAVERYPDNTKKAMDYLDLLEEDSEEHNELFPRNICHSFVLEDSEMAEDREEWYSRQFSGGSDSLPVRGVTDIEIVCDDTSSKKYLSLVELGRALEKLNNNCRALIDQNRQLPNGLKIGEPNLLVATPDAVLKTVLSLYMEDEKLPLPTHEEVLLCSEHTTDEEVTLLWKRAMGDPNHFRIFCLVHAELLSYQVCDKALKTLFECSQGQRKYKLVIICSNEEEDKSHIISKLQFYRRPFTILYSNPKFSQYLKSHFISWPQSGLKVQRILASVVDPEISYVRVVKSERAGMGKSLYIQRMTEELETKSDQLGPHHVIIPVHGPKVTFDTIVQALKHPFGKMTDQDSGQAIIFHIDISPSVLRQVDSVLFSLLILQAVCDSQGRIWRCHPAHLYTIEVTVPKSEVKVAKCTISLLDILPTMECLSPRNVLQMLQNEIDDPMKCSMDTEEFRSPVFQRVYQYLRRHVGRVPLDRFSYRLQSVEGKPVECLQILLTQCGIRDPSWSELRHFVGFLDTQLRNCEKSIFCNEDIVGDVMSGLKTFVVKFMIRMSKDFATSSLKGEVATENEEIIVDHEQLEEYQIDMRKKWEQNYHPYLFFNEDGMSITFVGFNATRNGDLRDPVKNVVIEAAALTPQLYTGLQHNQVNLSENYQAWGKDIMIQKIGMVMGLETGLDPDETYVLTVDNVIKIMAIHMRFRCNIPVVIMGETGCGKTRLIRFMCDLAAQGCRQGGTHVKNMLIMKIHGGTTENDIVKKVEEAEEIAQRNRKDHKIDTVLFFDEANTTEAIGLIKEVMCDRHIHGRSIKADVKFIAACNPYRKHTDDMIKKLESAGLGFYVKATETQHKLGTIPLRQLVYRVLDLPPSMRPLVYDFGQLNNATEKDYTKQIVKSRCQSIPEINGQVGIIDTVADVLAWSQKYMKKRNDECSFVSLRDVERVMIVFRYFCEKSDLFTQEVKIKAQNEEKETVDEISRALILAVSVCYHARLQDRKEYEHGVVKQFKNPLGVPGGAEQFCNEIRWCQNVLLDNMKLGPNIAKNAALRENVFMMSICIELRIPLFLVGKPGSSKSLAKSIVADSMLGRSSEKELMKEFKEVHMFSYQCSQLSTPESVIEIFNSAKSFQKKQDTTNYVSVVVLDEVGLAEDSPNLPLKALHPLLEDGTEGADDSQQIIEREQRVAFIGISNWALDPAKMNRGVMVTRGDPDKNELELSARGICSNCEDDPVKRRLDSCFKPLAAAYKTICDEQNKLSKAFFGLRDFYSLIKMLYWMCEKSKLPPTGPQLQHAIKRNFGGLEDFDTFNIFKRFLKNIEDQPDLTGLSKEDCELLSPDCSPLGLIRKSLQTKETSWHGENRYLLFLTENYAALQVLKHYLHEEVGMTFNQERSGLEESVPIVQRMEPFVLFGSSFPKDREYTQVCRNINQIKICMETGRTVILLNLENLYESLYDLLNQYYIWWGDQRYVDLGLQTHRVKCRVRNDFKLILIAEKTTVYEKFPTPLINRLEKHFVLTETVLLDWQKEVLTKLTKWVHQFSKVTQGDARFTEQDAFVGYQSDTPASVIFQATQQQAATWHSKELWRHDEKSEEWKEAVLTQSKKILLQMASPDALIRLCCTALADDYEELCQIYFSEQHHGSIVQFLVHHLHNGSHISGQCGLLIQVTTHSHLLSSQELNELCQHIDMREDQVLCFLLQEFDTEMDFSNKISPAFSQHNKKDTLLIIQCDSGHLFGDLIACARYRIDDEREKANYQWKEGQDFVHVLFIIHLPRQTGETDKHSSSFVGFQGGSWISAHIDDIRAPLKTALTLNDALSAPISDLFYNRDFLSYKELDTVRKSGSRKETLEEDADMEIENLESLEVKEQILEHISDQDMETINNNDAITEEDEKIEKNLSLQMLFDPLPTPLEEAMLEDTAEEISVAQENEVSPVTRLSRTYHNQCYRLYNCIQAAVARMVENNDTRKDWAAHRVRLLFSLIPQNPTYPLDDHTFYGALVKHIRNVLKERDIVHQDKEWVLKEALSGRKLQIGGTFQNVLERRLDEVIVPIFAAILSFTDHYSNLDLIKPSHPRQEGVNPLQQLWLQMFSDDKLCQFSYESFSMGKGIEYHDFQSAANRIGTPGVATKEQFSCQFPFFWLVKETVDAKLEGAKHTAGGHRQGVHIQLCEILTDTPIASILNEVSEEHWIEFYQLYLHDYLRSVHLVTYENQDMAKKEYEIIGKALHTIITGPDFISGLTSFLSLLAAVHVVYHQYQQEIMWFGQLTTHIPGILVQLDKTIEYSSLYMELPLYAVKVAINENNLALPLDPEKRDCVPQRLIKLQLCQNSIESILTLGQPTELTKEIRLSWQHVRAIQLFIEHIAMKCSLDDNRFIEFVQYANRLEIVLKTQSDFTKVQTILGIQRVLRSLDRDTGKKLKYASNMQKKVRDCCKSFFMEVVSSLCFGQPNPPEPALIKELLTVVFTEQDKTKDFSYSDKEKVDKVPVIRSFLLQLLLEHNTEIVREHLEDYFTRSQQIIKDDRSLCLLCIQCFEDVLHKQYSYIHDKVRHAHQVMNEVVMSSPAPSVEGSIHLQYLEGIAKLRYAVVVVAELLHCQHGASSRHQSYYTHETQLLIDVTKRCCNNDIINTDNSGPGVFLVKQLARQYGVSFLTNLTSDQTMQWIVPHHLQRSNEDQQTNDPFVIYQVYGNLRTILTDAVYGEELDKLQKTTERLSAKDAPALMLGIYQVITGSCVFTDQSKKVTDEIRAEISSLTKRCKILNRSLMWTAQALIDNTYCGRLEPMLLRPGMSPQNRLLTDLIIHVVTALQSKEKLVILQPFIKMMNSPGELKGAYLPTMPEDSLPIARSAIGGAFYECPRGHPYFVSECGKPTQRYNCPQCGSAIGGQNHQLTSGNRTARITDTTETGYALGRPDQREVVPSSERTLSPAACAIIRVLMHTSLLWASCNNEHAIEGLIDLTKGHVRPGDLPLFFWLHLQCDINILSRAIGKSKDESCLILHMILKDIVTEEHNISTGVSTYATLGARNARTEWERCFNNIYIEPILNKLEITLQQATLLLVNDKKEDRDRLFYVIHERMSVAPKDILPHLWTYRSRITLEHLFQTLQTHKDTCPILHEFIQQEPLLRATQYLPGIVKLQQQMYELSHRRLDKTDVAQYTIGEFIRELGKGSHTEQKRNQFREKLDCVRNAWSLVKDKLKEHSRVPVDSEYLTRVTWDESLPLSYLIPTLTGPGVCTVALIDLLVGVHNDFIEKCHSQLKKKQKKDIMWREHKVPVSHIQHCHLLEYEHQLLSIVLSHCHYSLEHGKGQNVTYDLLALEKHVVDRFVHGRPLIQLVVPQVVYRKDVYTAETFANIRKNISPQTKLDARQQTEIVTELRTMQNLRDCLDVVEIVIGFLSSGRTDANTELKKYVKKVLKMERKFTSKKAMEYCSLGHILSLWETISVQMAKTLTLSRQEPFDSLGQDFLQILDKDVDKELRRFLRQVDILPLLNLLYEFIETNVRHRNTDEKDWPLIDTLVAHLDNYGLEGLPPQFEEQFPQTITVGQAVATWKAIVFYQQQHENDIKD